MQPIIAVFLFIALPWLNPFAPGPMPATVPLLFSWACAAGFFGVYRRMSRPQLVATVASAWLAAGLLSCAMGVIQYFGATASLLPWVNHTEIGEAFANLRQRNQFATLTNIALVALLWFANKLPPTGWLNLDSSRYVALRGLWLLLLAAGLLAVGNAASSSRTGLLQLVLLIALFLLWRGWRWPIARAVMLTTVLTYAAAALLLPLLAGLDPAGHGAFARLREGDAVCSSRLTLWRNVLQLIAQKPWLGWGWGELDYAHYMNLYDGPRFCEILDNAHNLPLHLAVELGVPLSVLVCGGFIAWVWRQKPWRETDPIRHMAWGVLSVILLHSLLEYPLWYGPFQMALVLCVGLLWRHKSLQNGAQAEAKKKAQSDNQADIQSDHSFQSNNEFALLACALAAMVLIAFIGLVAWHYHRISQIYLEPMARESGLREDTLAKISNTALFPEPVRFAELNLTPLTQGNALWTFNTATKLLHYSPEPRVIEKIIESAALLGRDDVVAVQLARYRAAFPVDYARWAGASAKTKVQELKRLAALNEAP